MKDLQNALLILVLSILSLANTVHARRRTDTSDLATQTTHRPIYTTLRSEEASLVVEPIDGCESRPVHTVVKFETETATETVTETITVEKTVFVTVASAGRASTVSVTVTAPSATTASQTSTSSKPKTQSQEVTTSTEPAEQTPSSQGPRSATTAEDSSPSSATTDADVVELTSLVTVTDVVTAPGCPKATKTRFETEVSTIYESSETVYSTLIIPPPNRGVQPHQTPPCTTTYIHRDNLAKPTGATLTTYSFTSTFTTTVSCGDCVVEVLTPIYDAPTMGFETTVTAKGASARFIYECWRGTGAITFPTFSFKTVPTPTVTVTLSDLL